MIKSEKTLDVDKQDYSFKGVSYLALALHLDTEGFCCLKIDFPPVEFSL